MNNTLYTGGGFLRGFLRGLNSTSEVFSPRRRTIRERSVSTSLQQDWETVGNCLHAVLAQALMRAAAFLTRTSSATRHRTVR
jgi:hypothetical protein